jgi:hypothetical protein
MLVNRPIAASATTSLNKLEEIRRILGQLAIVDRLADLAGPQPRLARRSTKTRAKALLLRGDW